MNVTPIFSLRSAAIAAPRAGHVSRSQLRMAADGDLLQWICPSCGFIFDESLGFKKKYPPGTKFAEIPTFNCPVCGASKNQFEIKKDESEGGNPIREGDFDPNGKIGKGLDIGSIE